jgi:hypothetical protein
MIAEGTEAASVTKEQVTLVAADVETFRRAHGISRKEIARTLGYSAGVISEFLAGKYNGDNAQVAIDIEGWLVEEEQRRARPATTQFVWTNVAMQIKATAGYCLEKRKIGLLYGHDSSGVGKTTALGAIHQELGPRRSTLCTVDKVDANPTGLLRKLCQSMHIDDSGSNKQRYDRLKEKLTGRSADMVAYLKRQQRRSSDESLAQICRRIFPRIDLMEHVRRSGGGGELLVTIEQVRQMFAKNKLKITAAAARFICELCNQPDSGSVGLCVEIVEYATSLGAKLATIDVPVLKEALARGLTTASAELVLHDLDDAPAALAKVG